MKYCLFLLLLAILPMIFSKKVKRKTKFSAKEQEVDLQVNKLKSINPKFFEKSLTPELLTKIKEKIAIKEIDFLNDEDEAKRKANIKHIWNNSSTEFEVMVGISKERMINEMDSTKSHLDSLKYLKKARMMELGAGSCRVYSHLFSKMFKYVEIVEPSENLIRGCLKNLEKNKVRIPNLIHAKGLEEITFTKSDDFDLIFGQFVAENITDLELVKFLINVKEGLRKDSVLFLKENVKIPPGFYITSDHHQRIRNLSIFQLIFDIAGYCYDIRRSKDMPSIPLYQMALRIKDSHKLCESSFIEDI